MRKGEFHVKIPRPLDFAKMLVDLTAYLKPRLYIMDGITAMEGNGPMNGDPKNLNVLLFSTDPVALDATVCRIIDVNPEHSFTVRQGHEQGLGTYFQHEIELLGDPLGSFIDPTFNVNREPISNVRLGGGLFKFLNNLLVPKPYITASICKKCGICIKLCPANPKAVQWQENNRNKAPVYNYHQCIQCFCCQEVCPEGAIRIKKPWLRQLLGKKLR